MPVKSLLKRTVRSWIAAMDSSRVGRFVANELVDRAMERTRVVEHRGTTLVFCSPSELTDFRVDTFADKEPETLEWIDAIPAQAVLWDIGANVGLYSCYAAKRRNCRVFSFEPSVFNLELLARNVFLNQLSGQVTIVSLPIAEALAVSTLNMTSTAWGGALSTFGSTTGFDGEPLHKVFEFSTIGVSIDDATALLRIPPPDYIKLDVDGIEHLILKGASRSLREVRGVLVEINDGFRQQAEDAARYLAAAGLVLKEKRHGTVGALGDAYNQIWHRPA